MTSFARGWRTSSFETEAYAGAPFIRYLSMNIRSISGIISPYISAVRDKKANQSDADRDAQHGGGGGERRKQPLTPEELEIVLDYVRSLPGFKENNLTLRTENTNEVLVLFIEDSQGKIVRRMPQTELLDLLKQSQTKSPSTKGRILNKAV